MNVLESFAGNENFALTWDFVIIISVFAVVFLYAFGVNKKKLQMFILSIYAGFALVSLFPFWNEINPFIGGISRQLVSLALFLIFIFSINFALSGSFFSISFPKFKNKPILHIILLAASASGLLTSLIFSDIFYLFEGNLSTLIERFFAQEAAQFIWAIVPVAAMFISRKTTKIEH